MKKVLFIITSPSAGGAETYLLRFLQFAHNNIQPTVLCKKSIDGELSDQYRALCTLSYIGVLGLFNPIPYYKLKRFLDKNHFYAICDFSGNFAAWDLLSAKFAGVHKRIAFYRESRNQFKPNFLRNIYASVVSTLTHLLTTKILSNSYEALNHFHPKWQSERGKFEVIYNGLDMQKLSAKTKAEMRTKLDLPPNAFIVCHSGRLTSAKNHNMIISCAKYLCDKYSDIYFIMMGRGVGNHYWKEIAETGLTDRIRFLGYRDDVLDVLKCADLFFFPSFNEGQPNALIEAMASGLPFVASDIPSIKETVPHSFIEDLVSPYDFDRNCKAIEKMYIDSDYRLSKRCEKWAQCHYESNLLFNLFLDELL